MSRMILYTSLGLPFIAAAQEPDPMPQPDTEEPPVVPEPTSVDTAPAVERTPLRPRWRLGAGGGLGAFLPGPSVTLQGAARLGAQLKPTLGLYGELGGMAGLGVGVSADGQQGRLSGVLMSYVAPMIEYNQGAFFVAGGPMLANGGWAYARVVVTEGEEDAVGVAAGGRVVPGLQGRSGVTLGGGNGRRGTTIAVDTKLMVAGTEVTQNSGVGRYSLAFMPTFYIGWDMR